ncbi:MULTISPECIES: terpene synthase family protein [unclassified Photorhabdus]|uniref:terpene synthase family protein n=1 Tax=unclassified Photorhabdus TaxID=2620880 RepID=UPI000DCBFD14|nr:MULTISPECIES: terpene synthase [unclassified Photorhabdus]RAX00288.1 terpene synthase [Photorhabdus sp. S9-53]RAX00481.1 terpene synthase [Photorhabdus sp. S10-54]RAX04789.1 terpene synthase [Photorhabdus sp. S8-52]
MNIIKIPPIPNPFPYMLHPLVNAEDPENCEIAIATREYADRFRLYSDETQRRRLWQMGSARLAGLIYPKGSKELLQVGSDFVMWGFTYDDEYCDEGPLSVNPTAFIHNAAQLQRALESPEYSVNNDRYARAMRDLCIRLNRYASPTLAGRFFEGMRTYIMTEMWKAMEPKPLLDDYLVMRMYGGGAWAYPVLNHVIAGINISQDEFEDRRVRALSEMMGCLTAWDCESYAYAKEQGRAVDDKEHNVISIMRRQYGYTVEQSMEHYWELRWRVVSLFLRLQKEVLITASPEVRDYINGLTTYYSGCLFWVRTCKRYCSISGLSQESVFEGGQVTDKMPPESFESLGLPSFEWWWEYDPARKTHMN